MAAFQRPRLSLIAALVLLLITVSGTLFLSWRQRPQLGAFELVRDVPAFHLIRDTDVAPRLVENRDQQSSPIANEVVGHYTLKHLAKGTTALAKDIGPVVPDDLLGQTSTVVGVPLTSAQSMNGRLSPGDVLLVTPRFGPNKSETVHVLAVDRAASGSESPFVVIVLVATHDETLIASLGKGDVTVSMSPPWR